MPEPMCGVFALPLGVDFPRALVAGLLSRMAGHPPEAMARVTLYLNTNRMRRRVTDLLVAQGAMILPRLQVLTDLAPDMALTGIPAAVPPLRRRLQVAQLVSALMERQPDIAPRAALYDLADSLAALMDEMQGEGVRPDRVAALDVSNHSAHWARTKDFLSIVTGFFDGSEAPDTQARQRLIAEALARRWAAMPPADPVIVAGSTGSRGTTALFMKAVAALPQGVLVLPGFDTDMPDAVWQGLDDALTAEDHPQYRFKRLFQSLDMRPSDVRPWTDDRPASPDRNRLISLSLRPAPVTDQWLVEGRHLPDLLPATSDMTLIEAPTPRAEALSIALVLRQAAEQGRTATLVTADRNLSRQVTAALDRWGIEPDDSAGRPLALSAPGRFLRHVAGLFGRRLTSDALLVVVKHPFAFTGGDRGPHLRLSRALELSLRAKGPAFPTPASLRHWGATQKDEAARPWADALAAALEDIETPAALPLATHIARHRRVAEALARGTGEGTGAGATTGGTGTGTHGGGNGSGANGSGSGANGGVNATGTSTDTSDKASDTCVKPPTYVILRRFNDFDELHNELSRQVGRHVTLPSLPQKHRLVGRNDDFIEQLGAGKVFDPARQHPAALPAHGKDGQLDDPRQPRIGLPCAQFRTHRFVQTHAAPPKSSRRAARRACSQPMIRDRRAAIRASHFDGLCTTSAR